jgi:hypothetical protein
MDYGPNGRWRNTDRNILLSASAQADDPATAEFAALAHPITNLR